MQNHSSRKLVLLITLIMTTFSANAESIGYLFAHGLGGNAPTRHAYIQTKVLLPDCPCYSYNAPEVVSIRAVRPDNGEMYTAYAFDKDKVSLGQDDDIAALSKALADIESRTSIIGFGVSKGAATWINTAAKDQPSNLKALVLESPFADANELIYEIGISKSYLLGYVPFGRNVAKLLSNTMLYKKYNPDGPQPIVSIRDIPNIPILFIHSKQDGLIHINHSRKLYRKLIKEGRTNVYLVETKYGRHANLLGNVFPVDDELLESYLKPLHAFYKHFELPYDQELASNVDLSKYQPSLEEITEKINADEQSETFYHAVKLGYAITAATALYEMLS